MPNRSKSEAANGVANNTQNELLKAALALAKRGIPSFPTQDKRPCWSNAELGVAKGEGGYKAASTDPDVLEKLFSHPKATEIAVPMGEMSGLMAVDCDTHKDPAIRKWVDEQAWLHDTLQHKTRSGGMHFFFKHPGNHIKFPATLREGVDIKAVGNGYVCWIGTPGYTVGHDVEPADFPLDVLRDAMKAKGGSGSITLASSWNNATDEELIARIQSASDLYPSLRSLSYRLPDRRADDGKLLTPEQQIEILEGVMAASVAAKAGHARHDDWLDRRSKIADLVESAIRRHTLDPGGVTEEMLLEGGKPFFTARPVGPQRETTPQDIEARVAAIQSKITRSQFKRFTTQELMEKSIPAVSWLVPNLMPEGGICSLAGASNVGKTRWLALLATCLAAGRTELMGLPEGVACGTLWIANEEHSDDIERRIKAATAHYGIPDGKHVISVRPKTEGTLRLVTVNEEGTLKLDEENIALIVAECRETGSRVIVLDPYVTLSDAPDENSSASASMISKGLLIIAALTGACIVHAHHTPKDRSQDGDWMRGDSSAWRGSGAIYSSLDCGWTLANWFPKNKNKREAWRRNYLNGRFSRWVVLDSGKIREGQALAPIVYELASKTMQEGYEVGVCSLSTADAAEASLSEVGNSEASASMLADVIVSKMGAGEHTAQAVHKKLAGAPLWPDKGKKVHTPVLEEQLLPMFEGGVATSDGRVSLEKRGTGNGARWVFNVVVEREN